MWDLPLKIFHWTLVVAVFTAFITAKQGEMMWHFYSAYLVLALLLFRLVWGFIGGRNARFSSFRLAPADIFAYLRSSPGWDGQGHSPLGAWSVVVILLLLLLQVGLGLFASDDILAFGPLSVLLPGDMVSALTGVHKLIGNVLLPLWFLLHIGVIALYQLRGQRLMQQMVSLKGAAPLQLLVALLWFLLAALLVVLLIDLPAFLGVGS